MFCCFVLVSLLADCGGETATGAEPKSAADDARASADSNDSSGRTDDDAEPASESAAAPERSNGTNCDDGTCSKCGNGICPAGWYCDENASGGGACSWLTECAEKPTCACVTRVLGSSCKCREDNGGLKVACD